VSFTQWIFLLGAFAVGGPIVAHLLAKPKFRRLPFTMLRFLQAGQKDCQSRRKVRDILILLLRCAIIVLIAALFARPRLHIKAQPQETRSLYYLGLDNSISMAYSDDNGSYLNGLIDSAIDWVRSADDSGSFNICALASGRWTAELNKEQALAEITNLKTKPDSIDIDWFLSTVNAARSRARSGDKVSVLVLSDFTPKTLRQFQDTTTPAFVDNIDYELISSRWPINNVAIVEAHANEVINGQLILNVTVVNYGQVEQNCRLSAQIAETESTPLKLNVPPNKRKACQLRIDVDTVAEQDLFLPVELSLSAGDGLREDDTFYLAVSVPRQKDVHVVLVEKDAGRMFLLKTAMNTMSQMSSYHAVQLKQVPIGALGRSDLDWADVVVCPAITERLGVIAADIKNFIHAGGKIIFFMTDEPSSRAAEQLWQQNVLPALPAKCIRRSVYIEPGPSGDKLLDMDSATAKSFSSYRFDRILLTGYLELKPHSESNCVWRFQNGTGFVYCRPLGDGTAVLVNTSADDSLGLLTKSNASLAFCSYLLGRNDRIREYCFSRGEPVVLPVHDTQDKSAGQKQVWIQTCDNLKHRLAVTQASLLVSEPGGIGWVKTLSKPTKYAGVNLPEGETDMAPPVAAELVRAIDRTFLTGEMHSTAVVDIPGRKTYKPIWKIFVWIIIVLLVAEPAIANRLKR
jgi:hypothetical protein